MKLIFEKSQAGRRAGAVPRPDLPVPEIPAELRRGRPPRLPELAEPEIVRHFTALADRTFGVDTGFYPLGSCTMKHNPRVNERVVSLPGFRDLHPLQEEEGAQGALELMWRLQEILAEVCGLDAVSLQPAAGSQGELTGLMLMRAYFADRGESERRRTVITADTAHGTNPASVTMAGYDLQKVETDARGNLDLDDLRAKVNEETAGLMLTNPSTLGLFDEHIEEVATIFHDAGALLYYDGANLNAVCGISRPGDMGFDIVHINLHKTFSQPHGGGGPGGGPVAVRDILEPYLPVARSSSGRAWNRSCPFQPSSERETVSGSTTTGRSRSARCAASLVRSASSSARTPSSEPTGLPSARCPRPLSSTRTTCSPACGTSTSSRSTGSACTSSSSPRGA
jgi:glycine dehydrogenase subunit 2